MGNDEPVWESDLVDLSGLTLEQIGRLGNSVLAETLSSVLTENSGPAERYAAFQNHL